MREALKASRKIGYVNCGTIQNKHIPINICVHKHIDTLHAIAIPNGKTHNKIIIKKLKEEKTHSNGTESHCQVG